MTTNEILSDFPFESNYLEVDGSNLHYIDEGSGDPILFLHGNPTSSYLWRNIIPYLTPQGRCIAPDLMGMGKSDKPNIEYSFFDHAKYLEGFIEKLELKNITLVIHDWGSGLGFHYAMRNENNIKGIAFMEALVKPFYWNQFPRKHRIGFKLFRTPFIGWLMISVLNVFIKKLLPQMIVRPLTTKEMNIYSAPFKTIKSRKPVREWPRQIPIDKEPSVNFKMMNYYSGKLQESQLPKILFHADPGAIITADQLQWCKENIKNLKTVDIGKGYHYIQEDNPQKIGEELAKWYKEI